MQIVPVTKELRVTRPIIGARSEEVCNSTRRRHSTNMFHDGRIEAPIHLGSFEKVPLTSWIVASREEPVWGRGVHAQSRGQLRGRDRDGFKRHVARELLHEESAHGLSRCYEF